MQRPRSRVKASDAIASSMAGGSYRELMEEFAT